MNFAQHNTWLIAQQDRFSGLEDRFGGQGAKLQWGDLYMGLALVVAVGIGLFLLSRLAARQERRRTFNSPRRLFRELCKAHRLTPVERRRLKQIARHQQLTQPARIFLEPERLSPANLSPELKAESQQVAALRKRLFAGLHDPLQEPNRQASPTSEKAPTAAAEESSGTKTAAARS